MPWLINYIRAEKQAGGVAPLQEDASAVAEAADSSRIYWNFRDDCWIARAKGIDGTWLRTSRGVKRRRRQNDHVNFQEAKNAVFQSLEKWVADVGAGLVTKADLDAESLLEVADNTSVVAE